MLGWAGGSGEAMSKLGEVVEVVEVVEVEQGDLKQLFYETQYVCRSCGCW